jgi:hypothetical protein
MVFAGPTFTLVHVLISLVGIGTGLAVLADLLAGRHRPALVFAFLATTLATSLTGFLFPISVFTPALGFGVLSVIVLAVAGYALYARRLRGVWRPVYVVTALLALYLNLFVLVVQAFLKVPVLAELAPNGDEPPFAIAQGLLLVGMLAAGWLALRRFRPLAA